MYFQVADSNDVSALVRAEMDELLLLKRVLQAAGALQDVSVIYNESMEMSHETAYRPRNIPRRR